jgi:hypothetical protein
MKSISEIHVVVFAILIAMGVLGYNLHTLKKTQQEVNLKQELINRHLTWQIDSVQSIADKAASNNIVLAETVLYLDSCQQAKTVKHDKAERRGRFVGGLLKGLFPGL